MDANNFIGRTIPIISKRTGRVVNLDIAVSSCYPTQQDFQAFLLNLYMKDFGVYQAYSQLLLAYLSTEPRGMSEIEIAENKAILTTINTMYLVRDRIDKEMEQLAHKEMQEFIQSLSTKQK